jgi:hypothetical protein
MALKGVFSVDFFEFFGRVFSRVNQKNDRGMKNNSFFIW